jgi:hypothetical protein
MAIFKKTLPASLRADSLDARDTRSVGVVDRRPYLVSPGQRKPAMTSLRQQLALFPHESEDARLTGATRSLYRRLLALNLPQAEKRIEVSSELPHEITDIRKSLSGTRIA